MGTDLDEIRKNIDLADRELVAAFCRRMDLVREVAAYKIANGLPVLQAGRENVVLDKAEQAAGPEYGAYARDLYTHVLRESRLMQQKMIDESR